MAENVFIEGFGRDIPDFATEETLKVVTQALAKANVLNENSTKFLAEVARGEKRGQLSMNKLLAEMKTLSKTTATGNEKAKDQAEKENEQDKKQTSVLEKLLMTSKAASSQAMRNFKSELKNDEEMRKLLRDGMDRDSAGIMASLKGVSGVVGKVADAAVKIGAAVVGANNYFLQQGQDRFNFAQELRQSGLAAGLDSSAASLTGFADTVRQNNFTLGEAAAFTQRFSQAVGVVGVDSALGFANSMAYAGEGNSNMMRRFGMEFGEVANISGEYLDSVRGLGMLDRMSQAELRTGMEDFMSTVVATSNIMKINMEDAAQMIKNTLGRDDITALLGTLDPQRSDQIRDVVGLAGGMQSGFGEAIAQRLAAGSQQEFMQTEAFRRIQSSPIAMELLPVIERLAIASEQGGTEGFQREFANLDSDIARLRDVAVSQRVLITSASDQFGTEVLSSLLRLNQTAGDADKGFARLSDDDIAALGATEVSRQFTVALEGVNTQLVKNGDFAQNIQKLNEANIGMIATLEAEGTRVVAQYSDDIVGLATTLQAEATEALDSVITGIGSGADYLGLFGEEANTAAQEVRKFHENITRTFGNTASGIGTESIEKIVSALPQYIDPVLADQNAENNSPLPLAYRGYAGEAANYRNQRREEDIRHALELHGSSIVESLRQQGVTNENSEVFAMSEFNPNRRDFSINETNNFEEIRAQAEAGRITVDELNARIRELIDSTAQAAQGMNIDKVNEQGILIRELQNLVKELQQ